VNNKFLFNLSIFLLASCAHYSSNVEIVYNASSYKNSGTELFTHDTQNSATSPSPYSSEEAPRNHAYSNLKPLAQEAQKSEPSTTTQNSATSLLMPKADSLQIQNQQENKYHVVQEGETYYSIARLYYLNPSDIMKWNGSNSKNVLKPGTILKIYPGNENTNLKQAEKTLKPPANSKPTLAKDRVGPSVIATKGACKSEFIMPLKANDYSVLEEYNKKTASGIKNDGIILGIKKDLPVKAAANGEVAYVGDGFSDYGNIIILKHARNYFSIYGYLKTVKVKKGQFIIKGDIIAVSSSENKKLYFSIRKGKNPINPKSCL
jgi:lipoprotein NlpD